MGGARKKLIAWGGHEFGPNPVYRDLSGKLTGNCQACASAFKALKPSQEPPCRRCPKYRLHPDGFGLLPSNALAVDLYRLASRQDLRAGDGAYLFGTMTAEGACAIIDRYDDLFPTAHSKRETLHLMWILDRVITAARSKMEETQREQQRQLAEQKAKLKQNRR